METSREFAGNGEYVGELSFLLWRGKDKEAGDIALELLLKKGRPYLKEEYFSKDVELLLLNLLGTTYGKDTMPDRIREQVIDVFSLYIDAFPEFAVTSELFLLRIDYEAGMEKIAHVMDKTPEPSGFRCAWSLVNRMPPEKLAGDLILALDEAHLAYFIEALRFSSNEFADSVSQEFMVALKLNQG